jgi:phage-related protein
LLVTYSIVYYSHQVQSDVLALPDTLQARYIGLTARMMEHGPNLGLPHTDALGGDLFELRLKGVEGIARIMFCLVMNRQIVVLHVFIKKTQKTPARDLKIARLRMKEFKQ